MEIKKQGSKFNEPLMDVRDIQSKISSFHASGKLRNSMRSNLRKNSSLNLARDESLPAIKGT